MDAYKLKAFCTVAETKSFSNTSQIIHLTQPAVSLQIQALEDLYETKLFDRSSSSINLTTTGEVLYHYSKSILELYANAKKEIDDITRLTKGVVSLGASTTIGNYILPRLIFDFKKTHPKIKINILIENTTRVLELLTSGVINFGLVEGDTYGHKIKVDPVRGDEFVFILPASHLWARKKTISILEIMKEPFIIREEGSDSREIIEKYLAAHGIKVSDMHIVLVLGGIQSIKEAVERGMGISMVSRWAVQKEVKYGTLKYITAKEGRMLRNFSLIRPKNAVASGAVDALVSYIMQYPYDSLF